MTDLLIARPLSWIETGGGPLLFAARATMKYWNGSSGGTDPTGASDYARACAVSDEIDVIFVNDTPALVLGDEPDRTALVARSQLDVIFIRWRWAVSEESLISALEVVDLRDLAFKPNGIFRAISDNYELFDSAYSGTSVVKSLSAQLMDRTYSIETAEFRPDKKTFALLHRVYSYGGVPV
jgi:hypothetical protein